MNDPQSLKNLIPGKTRTRSLRHRRSHAVRAVQGHPHQRISEAPCPEVSGVLLVAALLRQCLLPRTGIKKTADTFEIVKYIF